jgi:hypothetical protein
MSRPRLTYANVMSTIAVFIALGGTSYAVARNSIGPAQLKRNAVSSVKVKDRSLRTADLAPSARIGSRGPRGLQGPIGPAGIAPAPEAWKPLPFVSGWADYGGGYMAAGYRKDQLGKVHLRGMLTLSTGVPARSSTIAVLPPGYRPSAGLLFTVGAGQPESTARIELAVDGQLLWTSGAGAEGDYTSLDQVSYWPE